MRARAGTAAVGRKLHEALQCSILSFDASKDILLPPPASLLILCIGRSPVENNPSKQCFSLFTQGSLWESDDPEEANCTAWHEVITAYLDGVRVGTGVEIQITLKLQVRCRSRYPANMNVLQRNRVTVVSQFIASAFASQTILHTWVNI